MKQNGRVRFYCIGFIVIKPVVLAVSWLLLFWWCGPNALAATWTLADAIERVNDQRKILAMRRLDQSIAHEGFRQVRANLLPTVSVISSNQLQDEINLGGVGGRFAEAYQHTGRVNLSQTLFGGGGEYFLLAAAKENERIAEYEKREAELTLAQELAQLLAQSCQLESEQQILQDQLIQLRERQRFLKRRASIGRSREAELVSAESSIARSEAELVQLQGLRQQNKANLDYLVGTHPNDRWILCADQAIKRLEDIQIAPISAQDFAERPRISAYQSLIHQADAEYRAAYGSFLPMLVASGNYYWDRAGILAEAKWDVTLTATWEVFSGFGDEATIRREQYEKTRLEFEYFDFKASLERDALGLQDQFRTSQASVKALLSAQALTQKNVSLQKKEFAQGLVNNLEVLQSMQDYLAVKRLVVQERYRSLLIWVNLQLLKGQIP